MHEPVVTLLLTMVIDLQLLLWLQTVQTVPDRMIFMDQVEKKKLQKLGDRIEFVVVTTGKLL